MLPEVARDEYLALVELISFGSKLDVLKGKQLWILRADALYKESIGEGIDTWGDFLKLPEVSIEPREATRLMEIYEEFVIKLEYPLEEVAKAKTKSLHYLLPLVKKGLPKEKVDELLTSATQLTQAQFKEEIYDVKKGTERTYTFMIMQKCQETGTLQKVHGITSEEIMSKFELPTLSEKL